MRLIWIIYTLLIFTPFSSLGEESIGVNLECKSTEKGDEKHNPHIISINYRLGTALYISPNKLMIKQYPSETPDSFQGDKDINSAVITHGFAVLESISYYSSGEFSWIDKRVFEINKDGASYLHSIGSNIRNPKTTRGKCKLLTGLQ